MAFKSNYSGNIDRSFTLFASWSKETCEHAIRNLSGQILHITYYESVSERYCILPIMNLSGQMRYCLLPILKLMTDIAYCPSCICQRQILHITHHESVRIAQILSSLIGLFDLLWAL